MGKYRIKEIFSQVLLFDKGGKEKNCNQQDDNQAKVYHFGEMIFEVNSLLRQGCRHADLPSFLLNDFEFDKC